MPRNAYAGWTAVGFSGVCRTAWRTCNWSGMSRFRVGFGFWRFVLMTNHVHFVVVPEREDSVAVLFRRVNGRYAQYVNVRRERVGHLWQNRYRSGIVAADHEWTVIGYVERNPVRAQMVARPED